MLSFIRITFLFFLGFAPTAAGIQVGALRRIRAALGCCTGTETISTEPKYKHERALREGLDEKDETRKWLADRPSDALKFSTRHLNDLQILGHTDAR